MVTRLADDSSYDQLLTEVEVGPVPVGVNKFEFLRVGYYVSNEAPEHDVPTAQTVTRTVLAENPRRRSVDIDWLAPASGRSAAPAAAWSCAGGAPTDGDGRRLAAGGAQSTPRSAPA
ncbi:hypothetical protein JL720_15836 [Aureococcus anophagefferens]|nr:hypothetical protein JL720_15836 [Aureococcus anophagefferens]